MSNSSSSPTPLGEIVLVGRAAYQLFSRTYRGNVEFYARVGKPFIKRETGESGIIPHMMADSTHDFGLASERAGAALEELRTAAFRHDVHRTTASVKPLSPMSEKGTEERLSGELKLA